MEKSDRDNPDQDQYRRPAKTDPQAVDDYLAPRLFVVIAVSLLFLRHMGSPYYVLLYLCDFIYYTTVLRVKSRSLLVENYWRDAVGERCYASPRFLRELVL